MCQSLSILKTSCAYIFSLLKFDPQRHKSVSQSSSQKHNSTEEQFPRVCFEKEELLQGETGKIVISQMSWADRNSTTDL